MIPSSSTVLHAILNNKSSIIPSFILTTRLQQNHHIISLLIEVVICNISNEVNIISRIVLSYYCQHLQKGDGALCYFLYYLLYIKYMCNIHGVCWVCPVWDAPCFFSVRVRLPVSVCPYTVLRAFQNAHIIFCPYIRYVVTYVVTNGYSDII